MTIPETKNKWINRRNYLLGVISRENSKEGKRLYKTVNSLIEEMIADLDTLPECKTDHHNEALNLLMNLSNFGAEFNDEKMAVDLITEALKRTNECNGLKIDYTKETCTSCGCKNHDQ